MAGPLLRRVVVSPHLDDAVLSCFAVLSGATVVTVLSGGPDTAGVLSDWDAQCGTGSSRDLMATRRTEDLAALALAGAQAVHLPFREEHYGGTGVEPAELAAELADATEIWLPAGIGGNHDHVRTRAAGFAAIAALPAAAVWLYAEYPYHQYLTRWTGSADPLAALATWFGERLGSAAVRPIARPAEATAKRAAVACYATQLPPLQATIGGHLLDEDLLATEYAWLLRKGATDD
jgi:LmbE family N-acetylglucosaminyl deacetylase